MCLDKGKYYIWEKLYNKTLFPITETKLAYVFVLIK